MHNDIERDLELMMLGAVLARPELLPETNVATRQLQDVLEAIRRKDQTTIKRWLSQRGVEYEPGQAFNALQSTVRRRFLKARCIHLTDEIAKANKLNLSQRAEAALNELNKAQGQLNEINHEARKRQEAKAKEAAEKRKAAQANAPQESKQPKGGGRPDDKPAPEKRPATQTPHQNKPSPQQAPPQRQQRSGAGLPAR